MLIIYFELDFHNFFLFYYLLIILFIMKFNTLRETCGHGGWRKIIVIFILNL